jgi:hypothetical protein
MDLDLFVPAGFEEGEARGADDLRPREYDQLVYQVGDDPHCAFMARFVRALGGTVVLHAWALPSLALALHPSLARGGWAGLWFALREGGAGEALTYCRQARRGTPLAQPLILNRAVVRFGDAFVVHDEALKARVLDDRNQLTPIAVLPRAEPTHWDRVAAAYAECLDEFPRPRATRKRLVVARVIAGERRRRSKRGDAER